MKRSIIIILLFGLLLISRLFFISGTENIISYITIINSISFIIVTISIIEKTFNLIKKEIQDKNIPSQIKNNEVKDVRIKKNILYLINLIVLIGILLSSEIYNDALSIFTIALSLLDEEISIIFEKIIKKWSKI